MTYAWATCPMGCGRAGGTVAPCRCGHREHDSQPMVRLWEHVCARNPALGVCIASLHTPLNSLPGDPPTQADYDATAAALAEAAPTLF